MRTQALGVAVSRTGQGVNDSSPKNDNKDQLAQAVTVNWFPFLDVGFLYPYPGILELSDSENPNLMKFQWKVGKSVQL